MEDTIREEKIKQLLVETQNFGSVYICKINKPEHVFGPGSLYSTSCPMLVNFLPSKTGCPYSGYSRLLLHGCFITVSSAKKVLSSILAVSGAASYHSMLPVTPGSPWDVSSPPPVFVPYVHARQGLMPSQVHGHPFPSG